MIMMHSPVKILFVIDFFRNPHAGTEGQLYHLIKQLKKTKFTPHLLVFEDSEYLSSQGFPCDYSVLGSRSLKKVKTWVNLWRFARRYYISGGRLAHVYFNDASFICPLIFTLAGIKVIISRRDMGYWYTPLRLKILRRIRYWVKGVVVNSQAVKAVTKKQEYYRDEKIHVIYNGYESPGGEVEPAEDVVSLRRGVLLGLVANIREVKRMQDAITALALLGDAYKEVRLVIVGAGDSTTLKFLAEKLGVVEQVVFLGARSDVKACLQAIDIGLLCSQSEGFSNAIIEYMQAGLPTICSNVGGNIEAIEHGKTGLIYNVGSEKELASMIKKLVDDPSVREKMGKAALREASARFSMAYMVGEHQKLYGSMLERVE